MDTSHHVLDTPPFAIATVTGHAVFAEGQMHLLGLSWFFKAGINCLHWSKGGIGT